MESQGEVNFYWLEIKVWRVEDSPDIFPQECGCEKDVPARLTHLCAWNLWAGTKMTAEKLRLFKWHSNEVNIFPECTFINILTLESFIKMINKGTSLTIGSTCSSHALFLKADFLFWWSWSRTCYQKCRVIYSSENHMALEEKCSDMLLATQLFMTQGELNCRSCKKKTVLEGPRNWHCDWLIVPLLLTTSTI